MPPYSSFPFGRRGPPLDFTTPGQLPSDAANFEAPGDFFLANVTAPFRPLSSTDPRNSPTLNLPHAYCCLLINTLAHSYSGGFSKTHAALVTPFPPLLPTKDSYPRTKPLFRGRLSYARRGQSHSGVSFPSLMTREQMTILPFPRGPVQTDKSRLTTDHR